MTLKTNISGEHIIQEVLRLLNMPRETLSAKAISTALNMPAKRLADLAERFDNLVARSGLRDASDAILDRFIRGMEVQGLEHIPSDGPLRGGANHPWMMDGLCITASTRRDTPP